MSWPTEPDPAFSRLGTRRRFPLVSRKQPSSLSSTLFVKVNIQFYSPSPMDYSRVYHASDTLDYTNNDLFAALLRRVDVCCDEMITRCDSQARQGRRGFTDEKVLRYEIKVTFSRSGDGPTERVYRSYQAQPLTMDSTRDVILDTDRAIALFLRRHDSGFRWTEGPVREEFTPNPKVARHRKSGPESMCCIPRERFLDDTQMFEFVPGYNIDLAISCTSADQPTLPWNRTLRIQSSQPSPITYSEASTLLAAVTRSIHALLDHHQHPSRHSPIYSQRNRGSTALEFRIHNNLGPQFSELNNAISYPFSLFDSHDGQESFDFLGNLEHRLSDLCQSTDNVIRALNDVEVHVLDIHGPDWNIDSPFSFILDSSHLSYRRTIEALILRIQTGVHDTIRNSSVSASVSVYKRGHLVFDKLLSSQPTSTSEHHVSHDRQHLLQQLKQRMHSEIFAIYRDSCALVEPSSIPGFFTTTVARSRPIRRASFTSSHPSTVSLQTLSYDRSSSPMIRPHSISSSHHVRKQSFGTLSSFDEFETTPPATPTSTFDIPNLRETVSTPHVLSAHPSQAKIHDSGYCEESSPTGVIDERLSSPVTPSHVYHASNHLKLADLPSPEFIPSRLRSPTPDPTKKGHRLSFNLTNTQTHKVSRVLFAKKEYYDEDAIELMPPVEIKSREPESPIVETVEIHVPETETEPLRLSHQPSIEIKPSILDLTKVLSISEPLPLDQTPVAGDATDSSVNESDSDIATISEFEYAPSHDMDDIEEEVAEKHDAPSSGHLPEPDFGPRFDITTSVLETVPEEEEEESDASPQMEDLVVSEDGDSNEQLKHLVPSPETEKEDLEVANHVTQPKEPLSESIPLPTTASKTLDQPIDIPSDVIVEPAPTNKDVPQEAGVTITMETMQLLLREISELKLALKFQHAEPITEQQEIANVLSTAPADIEVAQDEPISSVSVPGGESVEAVYDSELPMVDIMPESDESDAGVELFVDVDNVKEVADDNSIEAVEHVAPQEAQVVVEEIILDGIEDPAEDSDFEDANEGELPTSGGVVLREWVAPEVETASVTEEISQIDDVTTKDHSLLDLQTMVADEDPFLFSAPIEKVTEDLLGVSHVVIPGGFEPVEIAVSVVSMPSRQQMDTPSVVDFSETEPVAVEDSAFSDIEVDISSQEEEALLTVSTDFEPEVEEFEMYEPPEFEFEVDDFDFADFSDGSEMAIWQPEKISVPETPAQLATETEDMSICETSVATHDTFHDADSASVYQDAEDDIFDGIEEWPEAPETPLVELPTFEVPVHEALSVQDSAPMDDFDNEPITLAQSSLISSISEDLQDLEFSEHSSGVNTPRQVDIGSPETSEGSSVFLSFPATPDLASDGWEEQHSPESTIVVEETTETVPEEVDANVQDIKETADLAETTFVDEDEDLALSIPLPNICDGDLDEVVEPIDEVAEVVHIASVALEPAIDPISVPLPATSDEDLEEVSGIIEVSVVSGLEPIVVETSEEKCPANVENIELAVNDPLIESVQDTCVTCENEVSAISVPLPECSDDDLTEIDTTEHQVFSLIANMDSDFQPMIEVPVEKADTVSIALPDMDARDPVENEVEVSVAKDISELEDHVHPQFNGLPKELTALSASLPNMNDNDLKEPKENEPVLVQAVEKLELTVAQPDEPALINSYVQSANMQLIVAPQPLPFFKTLAPEPISFSPPPPDTPAVIESAIFEIESRIADFENLFSLPGLPTDDSPSFQFLSDLDMNPEHFSIPTDAAQVPSNVVPLVGQLEQQGDVEVGVEMEKFNDIVDDVDGFGLGPEFQDHDEEDFDIMSEAESTISTALVKYTHHDDTQSLETPHTQEEMSSESQVDTEASHDAWAVVVREHAPPSAPTMPSCTTLVARPESALAMVEVPHSQIRSHSPIHRPGTPGLVMRPFTRSNTASLGLSHDGGPTGGLMGVLMNATHGGRVSPSPRAPVSNWSTVTQIARQPVLLKSLVDPDFGQHIDEATETPKMAVTKAIAHKSLQSASHKDAFSLQVLPSAMALQRFGGPSIYTASRSQTSPAGSPSMGLRPSLFRGGVFGHLKQPGNQRG